jgi:hypothetical protein
MEHDRWVDAQLEAGNPWLWAELLASHEPEA